MRVKLLTGVILLLAAVPLGAQLGKPAPFKDFSSYVTWMQKNHKAPLNRSAVVMPKAAAKGLQVAIDLSAVAPPGIGGIEVADTARQRGGTVCYGALGVGGVKMKIHKAALRQLFTTNDQVLDAETIFEIGRNLSTPAAS